MKLRCLSILLSFLLPALSHGEISWQNAVTNYNRHEYGAANQNWMIEQSDNGWMYFANNKGLLEFDGVYWNTYALDLGAKMRSVKYVGNRVYVGGLGQFGYFYPNKLGQLSYRCLSNIFKKSDVTNIWNILTLDNQIIFQGDKSLFCMRGNKIRRIECQYGINFSAVVYNDVYVSTSQGIYILSGAQFLPVAGCRLNIRSNIVGMLPLSGGILIVTSQDGLYLYKGGVVKPFHTDADQYLQSNRITSVSMNRHHIAFGTMRSGAVLLNSENNTASRFSRANGLQNESVLSVFFDRNDNLWLGFDNGIDCISLDSPLFFFNNSFSSIGSGYASCTYHNKLYLGTNQGLYQSNIPVSLRENVDIKFIPEASGQVLSINEHDDKLFCGGRNFFLMIDGEQIISFPLRGVWGVRSVRGNKDILIAGTYWGLYLLKKEQDGWKISAKIKGADLSSKTIFVEEETNAIWVANKEMGLFRLNLSKDFTKVIKQKCYNSPMLPAGSNVYIAKIGKETVIASKHGLFRYNRPQDCLKPYTSLEEKLAGKTSYSYIRQGRDNNLWYVYNGMLKICHLEEHGNGKTARQSRAYLNDYLLDDFESLSFIDGKRAIIGTEDGFALLNYSKVFDNEIEIMPQIRKVYSTNGSDSLIYGRSFVDHAQPLVVKYKNNSLRIEYSACNYSKTNPLLYSCRLVGSQSEKWSEYSTASTKEYTNLPEGKYVFEVRIISNGNIKPHIASLNITVLPPWYRSRWAYLLYVIMIVGLVYYAYFKYKESRRLLIEEKDKELSRQEEHYKSELELQDQNELIRSRMNVVRKNEMLQEIRKSAVSINSSITEENMVSVKRKVVRLINQIDTNIKHDGDLEAFQDSFDAVHHDFFQILNTRYPDLTNKDRVLCAYIKMNLLSKEIAPLLNISVRGVEIRRYRLRKKLGLDEKENLADFLQHLGN